MTEAGVLPLRFTSPVIRIMARDRLEVIGLLDYRRHRIRLHCHSRLDLRKRCFSCAKEPETVEWIETSVAPGDVLYDVGANVGAYSLIASKFTNGMARVYAFEPGFSSFAQLNRNIILNRCHENVIPLQVALSNQTGISYLHYSSLDTGAARHVLRNTAKGGEILDRSEHVQPILCFRLDDLVNYIAMSLPNHIKLDVDGAELSVLEGAETTLNYPGLKSILMEFDDTREESPRALQLLESKGFRIHTEKSHGNASVRNCILTRQHELDPPSVH